MSYLDKKDPNYDFYLKSYLLIKYSTTKFAEYKNEIDSLGTNSLIVNKLNLNNKFSDIPKSSRDQILASSNSKHLEKKGNYYIGDGELYRVDSKTGRVNKFLFAE